MTPTIDAEAADRLARARAALGAVYLEDFARRAGRGCDCDGPGCSHGGGPLPPGEPLYLSGRCHPGAPAMVQYLPGEGTLLLVCTACGEDVAIVAADAFAVKFAHDGCQADFRSTCVPYARVSYRAGSDRLEFSCAHEDEGRPCPPLGHVVLARRPDGVGG